MQREEEREIIVEMQSRKEREKRVTFRPNGFVFPLLRVLTFMNSMLVHLAKAGFLDPGQLENRHDESE